MVIACIPSPRLKESIHTHTSTSSKYMHEKKVKRRIAYIICMISTKAAIFSLNMKHPLMTGQNLEVEYIIKNIIRIRHFLGHKLCAD